MILNRCAKKKIQYCLMRHPFPLSVEEFNALRSGPKVFANSMPKSGTHLLRRLLSLLPNTASRWTYHFDEQINGMGCYKQLSKVSNGQVVTGHVSYSQEIIDVLKVNHFSKLFMLRDLRDIAVSNAHYITNMDVTHRLHPYFKSLKTDDERILASIRGVDAALTADGVRSKSIGEHADGYLGWLDDQECLIVRFEDLIGGSGGGSDEAQLKVVQQVARHVGLLVPESDLESVASKVFSSKSRTFRKGQIATWKKKLTDEHKEAIKEVAGDALVKMGYEKDNSW